LIKMSSFPVRALVLLAAVALAPCALAPGARAGSPDPAGWTVTRPGVVLVDPAARAAELQRFDEGERRRLCPPQQLETDPAPVIRLVGPATESGADPAAQPFTLTVMADAAAALAGDRGAADAAVKLVVRWARADALSDLVEAGPDRTNANTLYSLKRVLLGLLPAWPLLLERAAPPQEQRHLVETWLARRVADADAPTGPAATRAGPGNHNHQRLMREAVVMAHGALTGDDAQFRRGGQIFLATLREMRPDGSLPLETTHGPRALWYQRHAVASLVMIAELARRQGYDLYNVEIDGKRLAHAVEFLLGALAEPSRLDPYASERQDLGFLEPRPSGRNAMAWLEPWHRRAPAEAMGALATGDITTTIFAHRPLIDELAGGNATCLFAKPD
jgi:poly(beta-D-mannuronate) lyase